MTITIYLDESRKNRQVIHPKAQPQCDIKDIVETLTKGNYYRYSVE